MKIEFETRVNVGRYGAYITLKNGEQYYNISVYAKEGIPEGGRYHIYGNLSVNEIGKLCIFAKEVHAGDGIDNDYFSITGKIRFNKYGAYILIARNIAEEWKRVFIPVKGGEVKPLKAADTQSNIVGDLYLTDKGKIGFYSYGMNIE